MGNATGTVLEGQVLLDVFRGTKGNAFPGHVRDIFIVLGFFSVERTKDEFKGVGFGGISFEFVVERNEQGCEASTRGTPVECTGNSIRL